MLFRAPLALLTAGLCALCFAENPPGGDEWKYDVIRLKNGQSLSGLILDQGNPVQIRCIYRQPGRATVTVPETIRRRDIARIDLLGDDDRKQLQERLESLKRERAVLADHLRLLDPRTKPKSADADPIVLTSADWPGEKGKALAYQSAHFRLVANARPEVVRLAVIHLEHVYAAYARSLPPRHKTASTTTILLTGSLAQYQAIAKKRGLNFLNPAFYDPNLNQVVCGSDLERLCDELQKVRRRHKELRERMKETKAELHKAYRGKVPSSLLEPMTAADKSITEKEKKNDELFAKVSQRLFTGLYHESFHAYLNTFVYPARDGALPLWFNEGLAQIFETAIVEVNELRVGHADPARLELVRGALARGKLLPLTDLLRSGPKQFQVAHRSDQEVSDRYYLASWALAFYLTFEKRLLGTKALDQYVHSLKRDDTNVLLAFQDLVGEPLPKFEKEYLQYLKKLRADGKGK